jgi:hypothetical protein
MVHIYMQDCKSNKENSFLHPNNFNPSKLRIMKLIILIHPTNLLAMLILLVSNCVAIGDFRITPLLYVIGLIVEDETS